ncbi:hypothetical protein PIB30_021006 [Stylosanthes scabra]|uniref:Uncharacterized protein n=1 Tax=Stylosanthes scabra TaxID=79078 RepID=A0ABU6T9X1_9FABA|nr:hypothetical protein [Stylosanthes scabra]
MGVRPLCRDSVIVRESVTGVNGDGRRCFLDAVDPRLRGGSGLWTAVALMVVEGVGSIIRVSTGRVPLPPPRIINAYSPPLPAGTKWAPYPSLGR